MESEAKHVLGQARVCAACNVSTGTHEECVEVDGRVYHSQHNPLRAKETLNCRVKMSRQLLLDFTAPLLQ